jgi:hypothetical protein
MSLREICVIIRSCHLHFKLKALLSFSKENVIFSNAGKLRANWSKCTYITVRIEGDGLSFSGEKRGTIMKCGKTLFPLLTLVIVTGFSSNLFSADQSCSMKLSSCPEDYNGQAVYVPRKVNVISPDFKVCMPTLPDESITGSYQAPSIMFIIDNSSSMMGTGTTQPRDSGGVRFKVVSALIDTIYKQFPDADIGLTVFQEYLYFDARSNPNFATFPDEYYTRYPLEESLNEYKNQAYIPLLRLDSTIQGGTKAIDLFKTMLLTQRVSVDGKRFETTTMQYEPGFTTGAHTNINAAFDATTYAMTKAKNGADAQFVIFLSDGAPNASNWPRTDNDYVNGWGMPTTFTVFFTDPNGSAGVPQDIATMTTNIKKGTYSNSNALSAYYSMNASYDSLLTMLMNQALKPIIATLKKEPSSLKLNNKTYTKYNVTDSTFAIDPIPLKDSITHMEMEIHYLVKVADSSKVLRDTTVKSVFDIIKSDIAPTDPNVLLDCHDTILYNVSINAPDREAAEEGPDNGSFQVTRTNPGLGDLTVYYTVQGTASRNTDYTSDKLYDSIKFVPGVSSETISITPVTDTIEESDETVVIKLLSYKNGNNIRYAINGADSAVVVIKNLKIKGTIDIAVLLNPFSRTVPILEQLDSLPESVKKSEMFGKLQQLIGESNSGTILAVKTTGQLKPTGSGIKGTPVFGKAVLYDALGNKVKNLEVGEIDKSNGDYGAFWDGTNLNNRKVGSGVYLMNVSINGEKKSIKVGVKE